jgi:hypothetical protein
MADFIHKGYLNNLSLCDKLIEYHNKSPERRLGNIVVSEEPTVDKDIKDSIDVSLYTQDAILLEYSVSLQILVDEYINKFEYCNAGFPWTIVETANIQYYPPGGGYKVWHSERNSGYNKSSSRHLVFMTYLNDVTDEGGTEFYYQKELVQPKKGLTLIWPVDWTHTHRGIPSPTQEKYIITGWFSYTG